MFFRTIIMTLWFTNKFSPTFQNLIWILDAFKNMNVCHTNLEAMKNRKSTHLMNFTVVILKEMCDGYVNFDYLRGQFTLSTIFFKK